MDIVDKATRSKIMASVGQRDTGVEMMLRSALHRMGLRYRLHVRSLPGSPDLVFPRYRAVVFVHGCYWHMHECRYGRVTPRTNAAFWRQKREGNVARDQRTLQALRDLGWDVPIVWECETKDAARLEARLLDYVEQVRR